MLAISNLQLSREMYAIVKFSNILVIPERRCLDLNSVPKMIRTKLYGSLKALTGLRSLHLGSGSGGWVTEVKRKWRILQHRDVVVSKFSDPFQAFSDSFSNGIAGMTRLVSFSLHYDCTESLISLLVDTCQGSLRSLDIERSGHVGDSAVDSLLKLTKLEDLNLFKTGLSVQGLSRVMLGLRKSLRHLRRGDFLCDALDHLDDTTNDELEQHLTFKIKEFWASEEYYFHSQEQMTRLAKRCPEIQKMLFMFQVMRLVLKNTFDLHLTFFRTKYASSPFWAILLTFAIWTCGEESSILMICASYWRRLVPPWKS